ncbi:MAG: hypothetical protein LZF62_470018 [Nitrospira sp.]|nr:MAG: hypothetical protein LZF62_470018 [Nitrospira sp.]
MMSPQEVNMVALIFLLLGVMILLAAAGRIWMNATPGTLKESNSRVTDNPDVAWPRRTA